MAYLTGKLHRYHNGSHFCVTQAYTLPESVKKRRGKGVKIHRYKEEIFLLYQYCSREIIGNRSKRILRKDIDRASAWIFRELQELHPEDTTLTLEEVTDTVTGIYHMFLMRYKTLKRKVHAYDWTWFVTITYDEAKFSDPETFRETLKRSLNHFVTRRGWRYFGVFEYGEEGERLHFHGVLFIPEGEMVGKIEKKGDYSTKRRRYEYRDENDFFADAFGRNEFSPVDQAKLRKRGGFAYLTKYIVKDNEKLVYSRHCPATQRDLEADEVDLLEEDEGVPFHYHYFGAVYIIANTGDVDPFWRELRAQEELRVLGLLDKFLEAG